MSINNSILEALEKVAQESSKSPKPEQVLFDFYTNLSCDLKKNACTSTGFTGVAEYLFFRTIVSMLKNVKNEEFKPEKVTKETCMLKSSTLILTHDLNLKNINGILPKMRPDVAIFQNIEDAPKLVAVFEVKLWITDGNILENLLKRLKQLYESHDVLLFLVLPNKKNNYWEPVNNFFNNHQERSFVIANEEGEFKTRITLLNAIKKIKEKLPQD